MNCAVKFLIVIHKDFLSSASIIVVSTSSIRVLKEIEAEKIQLSDEVQFVTAWLEIWVTCSTEEFSFEQCMLKHLYFQAITVSTTENE